MPVHHRFLYVIAAILTSSGEEIWEQDLSDEMKIGPTTKGYERVDLTCLADSMRVVVVLERPFDGVIYTRGSYRKPAPCYLDPPPPGDSQFQMNIPFDGCLTKNRSNIYQNVLIIQHDDDLIMPGDAAFALECDFSKDKEYSVSASQSGVASRITLADADPGSKKKKTKKPLPQVQSDNENVSFVAKSVKISDEL